MCLSSHTSHENMRATNGYRPTECPDPTGANPSLSLLCFQAVLAQRSSSVVRETHLSVAVRSPQTTWFRRPNPLEHQSVQFPVDCDQVRLVRMCKGWSIGLWPFVAFMPSLEVCDDKHIQTHSLNPLFGCFLAL
jgi:hypothetical protein